MKTLKNIFKFNPENCVVKLKSYRVWKKLLKKRGVFISGPLGFNFTTRLPLKTASFKIFSLFLSVSFFVYFLYFNSISAAINFPSSNDFNILPSNRYPYSNEEIEAKAKDASFDLNRSYIAWYVDGKLMSEGRGNDKINFKTGEAGSKTNLTATIQTPSGGNVKKSVILNIADIDLLWQTNTYTPYFYKGKSFAAQLSEVRMGAFVYFNSPNKKTASENLFFKWFLNDNLESQGQGKDAFVFKTGVFNDDNYNVKVEISTSNNKLFQQKSMTLAVQKPEILFYEYSPLEGIKYEQNISQFKNPVGEYKQFIAEPFFVPDEKKEGLNYEWSVNGQKLKNLNKPLNIINFSSEQGQQGVYNVSLTISYENLLEKISGGFSVNLE